MRRKRVIVGPRADRKAHLRTTPSTASRWKHQLAAVNIDPFLNEPRCGEQPV
jgi:hypothetical protein